MKRAPKYTDLADYCARTRPRKIRLAMELGLSRFRFAGALYPDRYPVVFTEEEIERLAKLLNQSADYVRKLYESKAA